MPRFLRQAPKLNGRFGAPLSAGNKESMVSRENYSYKKFQKELARKKKAEEKKQRKLDKKATEAMPDAGQSSNDQVVLE